MKKIFSSCIFYGVSLLAIFSFSFYSCDTSSQKKTNQLNTENHIAYFDYFTYKGDDDFFNNNKLPGNDYFYNPVLPGWYSDPSVCTNGKDFFMVTSTFSYYPGVPIFHSKDMVNWKQIGHVLDRPSQLKLVGQKVSEGIFAPAISYNRHNQTYYMITTNIGSGNFFVKTKDPFGSWSDPVWLPEVHGIDPSFFFDDDSKAYIVNNDEPVGGALYKGHRAIRIQQFNVETEKTFGLRKMLINGGVSLDEKPIWIEGPHLYKIKGKYFLMCAEGGTSENHREVIFKGDSPMGEFIPWDKNPILTQKHLDSDRMIPITCAGHADLIQKENGEWWSMFLACRPINNEFENLGRETYLMPVKWSEDGFPYMTRGEELVPRIVKMDGLKRDSTVPFGNFEKNDYFDSTKLGNEWMTLRGPAYDLYSLTDNPGFLSLKCAKVSSTELKTPAFICRRMQHHKFECTTSLYFESTTEKEFAGLLLFKDETHQYFMAVSKSGNQKEVSLNKISVEGNEKLAQQVVDAKSKPIKLKVVSRGTYYDFYYAVGTDKWNVLCKNISARYLSTAESYGFTGTNIGMYAI